MTTYYQSPMQTAEQQEYSARLKAEQKAKQDAYYQSLTYDPNEISSLSQQIAAPQIRTLRSAYQQAAGQNYDNPNVKRTTLRDALAGYGIGSANIMGASRNAATNQYMQRLQGERDMYFKSLTDRQSQVPSGYLGRAGLWR